MKVSISAIDIASCAFGKQRDGCKGAKLTSAWEYMHQSGVVTGGNYHSHLGCKPFPFPPAHDTNKWRHTSACARKCTNKEYTKKYDEDKIKSKFQT
jgi:cathepsin B